jgi:hypothetical protein
MSGSTDVMYSKICGSCNNAFGQTSKDSINNKVASTSCTAVENVNPASVPTPVPTPVRTAVPHCPLHRSLHQSQRLIPLRGRPVVSLPG